MPVGSILGSILTLIVLSMLIVCCGGVVPRHYQTWPVILCTALGIPAFLLAMAGFVGIFLG